MSDLAHAEAYRDQLHDLADSYTLAEEREIDAMTLELATKAFDRMDKEALLDEWLERHSEDTGSRRSISWGGSDGHDLRRTKPRTG